MQNKIKPGNLSRLRIELVHSREAFRLVTDDYSGNDPACAIEHSPYASRVYGAFALSINDVVISEHGRQMPTELWAPSRTSPRELTPFMIEYALSSGFLEGLMNQDLAVKTLAHNITRNWLGELRKSTSFLNTSQYKEIKETAKVLTGNLREAEVLQAIAKIRKKY